MCSTCPKCLALSIMPPLRPPDRPSPLREVQPHRPVALRVVKPFLAHFHMQEEMHRRAMSFADVLTRRGADRLDRAAPLAEHDLAMALAADEDRLLDAGGAVGLFLPLLGLDCRLIG